MVNHNKWFLPSPAVLFDKQVVQPAAGVLRIFSLRYNSQTHFVVAETNFAIDEAHIHP